MPVRDQNTAMIDYTLREIILLDRSTPEKGKYRAIRYKHYVNVLFD